VTPLKGMVYGGGQQQATVSVEVINLLDGSATTLPYRGRVPTVSRMKDTRRSPEEDFGPREGTPLP
jgi:hypothetical protein